MMDEYKLGNWINYAERYLNDIKSTSGKLSPQSTNILMGYCLEMLLKAILINDGIVNTKNDLKVYGHNLTRIYETSLQRHPDSILSLEIDTFNFKEFVEDMNEILKNGSDRYPKKSNNIQFGRSMNIDFLDFLIKWEKENLKLDKDVINFLE